MSITRDRGEIVIECDGPKCHATLETGSRNWDGALDALRNERWSSDRDTATGEYGHFCSVDCMIARNGSLVRRG